MLAKGSSWIDSFVGRLSTVALFTHGFLLLVLSITADFGTSLLMMTLRGANAEGNPPTRLLFEHPGWSSLVGLISSQYPWVFFVCLGIAAYGLTKANLPLAKDFRYLSTTLSWPLGAYRLIVGPSSNVAGILLVYGATASNIGYFVVFVSAGTLVVIDFLRTLRK